MSYELAYNHPIKDQGITNMCTGFASSVFLEMWVERTINKYIEISSGFLYANRKDTDYQGDSYDNVNILQNCIDMGFVPQEDFPNVGTYENLLSILAASKASLLNKAQNYKVTEYTRLWTTEEIKQELLRGYPVLASYMRASGGEHAVVIIGWNDYNEWKLLSSGGGGVVGYFDRPFTSNIRSYKISGLKLLTQPAVTTIPTSTPVTSTTTFRKLLTVTKESLCMDADFKILKYFLAGQNITAIGEKGDFWIVTIDKLYYVPKTYTKDRN